MSFENIFSDSIGCLLVLLIVSIALQKFFILMTSQQFSFDLVSLTSGHVPSKNLLQLMSKKLLPVFSSRILMISCLTFRCFIHFEFIFVCGVRKCSSFILLHVAVFPKVPFVENTVFFSSGYSLLLCQRLVDHIVVGPFLSFPFCSIDLCVCFCIGTILS